VGGKVLHKYVALGALFFIPSAMDTLPTTECGNWHHIQKGETISKLAAVAYGDAMAYDRIYQANLKTVGKDPGLVEVGMQLYVPCVERQESWFSDWYELPDPVDLANLQKIRDVQIVDIRPANQTGGKFVPDSVSIPFSDWRFSEENPGQPPDDAQLSAILGDNGIRLDQPTVIVHAHDDPMDMGRAAFVYWLLKSAGVGQIGILEGGMDAWAASGLRAADAPIARPSYDIQVSFDNTWRATPEEVEAIASGDLDGTLVDGRPQNVFAKTDGSGHAVPSTLPHAVNFSGPAAFSAYKSADDHGLELLERIKGSNLNWEFEPIVNFCDTGEIGALNWFYASELSGIGNVKLYPESSVGWTVEGHDLAEGKITEIFRR
jgi:thiosulfate/3-mercaptopyruvate sulfurtransferase